jgi:putative tryptophan/tyrosine transport system substrate-binding protein
MQRGDFIKFIAGSAIASPLAARAPQPERMRRIGVLMAYAENDPEAQTRLTARMVSRVKINQGGTPCANL